MKRLDEQVAIVTGGAAGIGRGIATVLAQEGAHVVIADLDGDAAEATAAALHAEGLAADAERVDVADRAAVAPGVGAALKRHGRLDIVAANAGIYPLALLEEIDDAAWERVLGINAKGASTSSRRAWNRCAAVATAGSS